MSVAGSKIGKPACVVLGVALLVILLRASNTSAQPSQPGGKQRQSAPLIQSVEGPDLYRAYCASCHGANGKGGGPVARDLKVAPPDLTRLSSNGQFPTERVRQTILGDAVVAAHGTREMPIWGPVFHQIEADVDRGNVRTENLLKYLQSIQAVASTQPAPVKKNSSENTPSGAQLYKQFCAACHGNDLKGNGPGPAPFKDVPPDLTTLARRHGGNFPDDYVTGVLRNGITIPDHGPPEMPTWDADFKAGYGLNEAQVASRIANLTGYIKSRQAK
jgi:mono/diheme cytochrome c family protein